MSGDFLSVGEAAAALGVSEITVKRYIYAGRLGSAKLPGGRHRIPRAEVDRLLVGGMPQPPETEEVVEGLEARVSELEAALEQMQAGLRVVVTWCAEQHPEAATRRKEVRRPEHRVTILGPGCRRCDTAHGLVKAILEEEGITGCELDRITNVAEIAQFGPVLTPALVLDGKQILWSGGVPRRDKLTQALKQYLEQPGAPRSSTS